MGHQILSEDLDRGGVPTVSDEQHSAVIEVDEQGDIVVSPPRGGLIAGDPGDAREVRSGAGLLDVVVENPPQTGVMFANQTAGCGHRHHRHHRHDQGLEQQREAAALSGPRYRNALDATCLAGDARHPGVEVGLVLEEIEMAPGHFLRVIGRAASGAATRTGEAAAARKIKIDVEPFVFGIECATGHQPRRPQTQRHLKQFGISHRRVFLRPRLRGSVPPCSRQSRASRLRRWLPATLDWPCARQPIKPAGRDGGMVFGRTKGWMSEPSQPETSPLPTPDSEEA